MLLLRRTIIACQFAAILVISISFLAAADSEISHKDESFVQSARLRRARVAEYALNSARSHLAQREYFESFSALRYILDLEQDAFVSIDGVQRSLKSQANLLLSNFPADALRLYEVQFGQAAKLELETARLAGGREHLARIAVRYLHTKAGFVALQELAAYEFDHGNFSAAIAGYREVHRHPLANLSIIRTSVVQQAIALMRMHDYDRTGELIARHRNLLNTKAISQQGQQVTLGRWLTSMLEQSAATKTIAADWRLERGSPYRNRVGRAITPSMTPVWQRDIRPSDDEATLIDDSLAELREQGIARLSTLSPIIVGPVVIARTVDQLLAVDIRTGKVIWQNNSGLRTTGTRDNSRMLQNAGFRALFAETLVRQLQADTIFGTLSSDGKHVYCVESELMNGMGQLPNPVNNKAKNGSKKALSAATNQLVAYAVDSGEIKWHLGGPKTKGLFAGVAFLGPPLPYDGMLYVLGQHYTEIRLLAIYPEDGRQAWSLLLADAPRELANDLRRRGRSCPIAARDGLLICPTASGVVVAVDLLIRKPVWAYRYQRDDIKPVSSRQPARLNRNVRDHWWEGWREVAAVIDGDRVIVATPESNDLHALDLGTGKPIWKQPRKNGLYLAGSFGSQVLVVAEHAVRSYDVETGKLAWNSKVGTIGGRGYGTKRHYYLPLSRSGVAIIDLADGAVRRTFPASVEKPGNLVIVENGVISQTHSRIALLGSIEDARTTVTRRLAANQNDADASLEKALLERESGRFSEAETILQQLQSRKGSKETVQFLRETILVHLRERPDQLKMLSPQLFPLVETTMDRIDYFYAVAGAARQNGALLQSLDSYFELLELNPSGDLSGVESSRRSVRFDRQVQGEIADLFEAANPPEQKALQSAFDKVFHEARENHDPFALQRFADRFGQLRWGRLAYAKLASRSGIGVGFLKSQLKLLEISELSDRELAASALKQLAELMDARSFRADSAAAYRRLRERFANVRFDDGKTAAEIVADLPEDSLLAIAIESGVTDNWPVSKPQVTTVKRRKKISEFYPIAVEANRESLFDRLSVYVDRQGTRVRFQGDQHHGPWELKLPETKSPFRYMYPLHRGWGMGHLLVLRVGTDLYGISPLNENGEANARLVWMLDTMGGHLPKLNQLGVRTIEAAKGFGTQEIMLLDSYGQPLADVGPVRPGYLCYRQKGKLIAIETSTGSRLWQRFGLAAEVVASGDDEVVLLSSPDSSQLEILRAIDGKTVATRNLKTPPRKFLRQTGRFALTQEKKQQQLFIRQINFVDGHSVWERTFSSGTTPFEIDSQTLGAIETNGTLHVFSSRTGEKKFTNRVERPGQFIGVYAISDSQHFYIAVSGPLGQQVNRRVNRIRGGYRNPLVNGPLYAFDRQSGKLQWKRNLEDIAFPLDQPKEAPLFLLYSGKLAEGKGQKEEFIGIVEFLDKRTGEKLHQVSRVRGGQAIDLNANVEQAVVEIGTTEEQVRIQFNQ